MADSRVSDQPTVYTHGDFKDAIAGNDIYQRTQLNKAKKGVVAVLPLIDPDDENAQVRYIFDGKDLWHRADTKAAQVIRNTAKRQVIGRG